MEHNIRSTKSQIVLNAIFKWAVTFLSGVIGVFLVPFLLHKLGRDGYGLIGVIGSIVAFSTLIDLGISTALSRHLAAALAKKDNEEYDALVSTSLFCNAVLGVLAGGVLFWLSGWLVVFFKIPESLAITALWLIRIYGVGSMLIALQIPIASAVLTSHNRFDVVSIIQILNRLMVSISLFLVLGLTDLGLIGWASVSLGFMIGSLTFAWWQAKRIHKGLHVSSICIGMRMIRKLYSLGGKVFVLQAGSQLSVNANPMVLTSLLGPASVSLYSPAMKLIDTFSPIVMSLTQQLHPVATNFHVTEARASLQRVLVRGTRITLLMGILLCVVLGGFADHICEIWLKGALPEQYRTVSLILVLSCGISLLGFAAGSQWPVLLGMNRLGFLVWMQVPCSVINIMASIYLVGYTRLGIVGVVVPTLVIGIIRRPMLIWYTARVVKLRLRDYLLNAYWRPFVVCVILLMFVYIFRLIFPLNKLIVLAVASLAIACIWCGLCWFIGFDKSDRVDVGNILRSLIRKFKTT